MFNTPSFKTFILVAAGILIGSFCCIPLAITVMLTVVSILATFIISYKYVSSRIFQIFLFTSLMLCGMCHFQLFTFKATHNPSFNSITVNHSTTIKGYLLKDPAAKRGGLEYILRVTHVISESDTQKADFKILVKDYANMSSNLKYGDPVILKGKITQPSGLRNPGGFDYRKYLSYKNIFYIVYVNNITLTGERKKGDMVLKKIIYPVRRYMITIMSQLFTSSSTHSVINALILGDKELITEEILDSFSKTGIIHVLAVSGLHVGFILLMCITIFDFFRFNNYIRTFLTILVLIFYTLLTESHPPVVRAAIMASLYLLSVNLERKTQPFNIIGFAGLILIMINPNNLFSLSFILSFTAISSIIYFYNKLINLQLYKTIKNNHPFYAKLLSTMFVSASALIGTLPVSAYYFNRVPLISIIVNLFAIPLTALIVVLSFITIFFSTFSLFVASIYAGIVHVLVSFFISIIYWISQFNFSYLTVPSPPMVYIVIYFILLLLIFNFKNIKYRKMLLFLLLVFFNIGIWKTVIQNSSPKVRWIQFDVGQGDSALLITPLHKTVLIDGGPRSKFFDNGKQVIAQYLNKKGIKTINYVILTHPHSDHVGGLLYIVKNYTIDSIYYTNCPYTTSIYTDFLETAKERNIKLCEITSPDSLILAACKLYFLSPSINVKNRTKQLNFNVNNQSLVTYLLYGQTKILFMGDAEKEVEKEMLHTYYWLQCNALKVGHHGSITSSTFPFIKQVDPDIGIISAGKNNRFRHPSKLILQYFQLLDINMHRTDMHGAAVLVSDGKSVKNIDWR